MQSRLSDMDEQQDLVLFDEFHEEQGEMILGLHTCKCPTFLLSATPVDIPQLLNSTYLAPSIDRRHPILIHKTPDGMDVVDMFMEAQNAYPELIDKVLIIVPTHKQVQKVIHSLNYLKAGKVFPLTARERDVPKDYDILVATPYVQTGLDLKPSPKLLIDCGKDIVFNKGLLVNPIPWTDKDVNQQRVGRVGRLQPGVVYQPESAGSGKKAVRYPSPNLFMHSNVASHFKVPALTPITGALMKDLPFMRLNTNRLNNIQEQKSVTFIHSLALAGVRQTEWPFFHARKIDGRSLGEDYEFIDRIYNNPKWVKVPLLDWETTCYHLNRENIVQYSIEGKHRWMKPLRAINGHWQEHEPSQTEKMTIERVDIGKTESKQLKLRDQLEKFKSTLIQHAANHGDESFIRIVQAFDLT